MFATTFTTVNAGAASIVVTVGSFVGSESVSASVSKVASPSSLLSLIEFPAGLSAVAVTLFITPPASIASCVTT